MTYLIPMWIAARRSSPKKPSASLSYWVVRPASGPNPVSDLSLLRRRPIHGCGRSCCRCCNATLDHHFSQDGGPPLPKSRPASGVDNIKRCCSPVRIVPERRAIASPVRSPQDAVNLVRRSSNTFALVSTLSVLECENPSKFGQRRDSLAPQNNRPGRSRA